MSILIKGMEMPTCCAGCIVACDAKSRTGFIRPFAERLPDCPLVPIQPHGRLIDADTLKKILVTAIPQWSLAGCKTYADSDIMRWIDEAPTVIPEDEPKVE